jgi:hypothetical protein
MQSYDEIQGFEYWNIEAWKDFIKNYIMPLHNLTSKLLKLRDFILTIVGTNGKITLSEVERKRRDILPFLLGGIKEDGEYKDNSLAKLVRFAFGIFINPKEWTTLEKEEGLTAFDYVTIKSETTPFIEFLKKLNEITFHIIKMVNIESKEVLESEIEEIIQKHEKMLEIIKMLYIKCLEICANHNYYTFFTLSTKNLPFKYMIIAYPKLQANFNSLKDFLGLEKIFEPKIIEVKVKEDYTIWGHSKNGLCDSLYNLNNIILENFLNETVKNVLNYVTTSIKNLKQEYVQKVQQKLEEIKWKFPEYIKTSIKSYYQGVYSGVYRYQYIISGPILIEEIYDEYSWRGEHSFGKRECNISLLNLLDDLSPALFLYPSFFELKFSNNMLEIVR